MEATVRYQIENYIGEIQISCDENDENEHIIAMAKKIVRQKWGVSLPLGYESWKVVKRI